MKKLFPTILALLLGAAGLCVVLYAWALPPFENSVVSTENAYVRGKVTTISPQLAGHIAEVLAMDFAEVKEGDPLFRIDDRSYREKAAQAQSRLDAAEAGLADLVQARHTAEANLHAREAARIGAEAVLETAKAAWDRAASLKARGVMSASSADQAELDLRRAEAALAEAKSAITVADETLKSVEIQRRSLEAQVAEARSELELAEIDLDRTVIRAPAEGRLGEVSARVGQYVSAGTSLVSLVQSDVWVVANFKETQLPGMAQGLPVWFTVDALSDRRFVGWIERFSPAMASEYSLLKSVNATGNFTKIAQRMPIRIAIDEGQEGAAALAPGMSVVVHVDTAAKAAPRS